MSLDVRGTTALITGASSGIGEAIARSLAKAGCKVILVARTGDALEKVASEIRAAGGQAAVVPADLSVATEAQRVADEVTKQHGVPDILVNNAGAGRWLPLEETTPQDAVAMMALPYFAAFWLSAAVVPAMVKKGRGHIINLTSPGGWAAVPGAAGYSAARAAMRSLDQSLALELRGTGVGVTLLCPGKVSSPYFANNPGSEEKIPRVAALSRTLTPQEVGDAAVRAIQRGQRTVVMPLMMRLFWWTFRVMPWSVEWLIQATGWRRTEKR
jgi:short-subunit dehydrogenase